MHINRNARIAILGFILLVAVIVLVVIFKENNMNFFTSVETEEVEGSFSKIGSYNLSDQVIENINLDWGWAQGSVTIFPYDGKDIQINEYACRDLEKEELLYWNVENGELSVKYMKEEPKADKLFFSHVTIPAKELEIMIPRDMVNRMMGISVQVSTSNINIKDVNVENLYIESIDGNIDLSNISSKDFKVVNSDGNITLSNITSQDLEVESYSGDITFHGSCNDIKIENTDGDVDIIDEELPKVIDIDTDTGNVKLTIPNNSISLSYETDSGDFSSELPIKEGDGSNQYNIETVDGNIEIKALH
jgi:hypothetical protein